MLTSADQARTPGRTAGNDAGPMVGRAGFRAMGMDVAVIAPTPIDDAERRAFRRASSRVRALFHDVDRRFSRFIPESELSSVNARAGRPQTVSAAFAELLARALAAARETGGLFDPTILPALVAAGYDRDYEELLAGPPVAPSRPPASGRWSDVALDGRSLLLPLGAALDFGGIAKGWAVDQAVACVADLPWALVDAGGDLGVAGRPEQPVPVGIADPSDAGIEILRLEVDGGALATSSTVGRAWGAGLHHLIDPRTSRPARTGVLQATAWAPTCTEAEVRAKWALLGGPPVLAQIPGVLVMEDGTVLSSLDALDGAGTAPC